MSSQEEVNSIDASLSAERYRSRIHAFSNQVRRIQHEPQRAECEHGEHRREPEFHESASRAAQRERGRHVPPLRLPSLRWRAKKRRA